MYDSQNDPRTRKSRHELTAANLSSTIEFKDLPVSWNKDTLTSVIAGSGTIVSTEEEKNPEGEALISVNIDYKDASAANRALNVIQKIKHFPCKMNLIIPQNWEQKRSGDTQLTAIELDREHYPWDDKLELPFEMVSEVPLPRKPVITSNTPTTSNVSLAAPAPPNPPKPPVEQIQFPEILSRASQHLPAHQPGSMSTPDPVSQNLAKIPTLQLIEMLSNLKILENQENKRPQLEQFLKSNSDLTIAVTQAFLEMGLINHHVISKVLSAVSVHAPPSATVSNGEHVTTQPAIQQSPPPAPAPPQPQTSAPAFNESKLALLPAEQQSMIKTALSMSQASILALPVEQRQLIEQLKKDYLL